MTTAAYERERDFASALFGKKHGLAPMLGWTMTYRTLYSRGSNPGFPDQVLVRERVIFAELKLDGGKPTENQVAWLNALYMAGAEVYLWRPADFDEIAWILRRRGDRPVSDRGRSAWIVVGGGGARADEMP